VFLLTNEHALFYPGFLNFNIAGMTPTAWLPLLLAGGQSK
jgi:hypothetical protein